MEDKEFDKCNKKLKSLISKDRYGKMKQKAFIEILQWAFREGYMFGVKSHETNETFRGKE